MWAERRPVVRVAMLVAAALAAACSQPASRPTPAYRPPPELVVVLVPGAGGTALIDARSGRTLWGNGRSLVTTPDRYGLAIPLSGEPDGPTVIAGAAIDKLRLGPFSMKIYEPWKRRMDASGYPVGDPADPRETDRFFVFGYDWRRSAVTSSRSLGAWLEELAARRDRPLQVALIAQSNGALIARYVAKYGTATLDEAVAGVRRPIEGVTICGLALVGTANGGAIGVLEDLDRGRRNAPLIGTRWFPEVLFTFPSLYEALPVYRPEAFVDELGRSLDVNVFDPAAWPEYSWSIFSPHVSHRVARSGSDRFGDREARISFLKASLRRARGLHAALMHDPPGWHAPPLVSFQHARRPTVERAVLRRRAGGWSTGFGRRAVRVDGDGFASRKSQERLSAAEVAARVEPTIAAEGSHFELVLDRSVQRRVLEFLDHRCRRGR